MVQGTSQHKGIPRFPTYGISKTERVGKEAM